MSPVRPIPGDRQEDRIHKAAVPQVLEHQGVFIVLNPVAYGLQANSRSGLGGGNWPRRVEKDAVTWPAQAAARGGVQVVPAAQGVPGGPRVRAIVEDARCALRPIEESRLNAFVDWRIVHKPFRRIASPGVTTGVAPQVSATRKRQSRPLLDRIK